MPLYIREGFYMSIYQIYIADGIPKHILDEYNYYKITEHLAFIKTDESFSSIVERFGMDTKDQKSGIVCRIDSMNGWFNKGLWDWERTS